jgi:hypothetical protein
MPSHYTGGEVHFEEAKKQGTPKSFGAADP